MSHIYKKEYRWIDKLVSKERGFSPSFNKPVSMILTYPNYYNVGMSNLGFQVMYHIANRNPYIFCDRGFYYGKEPVLGFLSGKPLGAFDIVAFSVSYELDYFNIVNILRLSGINPLSEERSKSSPLVLIGGIAPTINPAPLSKIADIFVIGDGEEIFDKIAGKFYESSSTNDKSGIRILESLSAIDGVYCPKTHISGKTVTRQIAKNLDEYQCQTYVLTPNTEFPDRFLIETGRGCGKRCKYCAADYIYPKPLNRSKNSILEAIDSHRQFTHKTGLLGIAVTSHPDIETIVEKLKLWNMDISISSLRVESVDEKTARMLIDSGQRNITLAPETGSDELRFLLNKRFTTDFFLNKVDILVTSGLRELKLYLMIGLPDETEADIEAIEKLALRASEFGIKVKININAFIPKPHTPFQLMGMEPEELLKDKISRLKSNLRLISNLSLSFASLRESYLEALLCRANSDLGKSILVDGIYNKPRQIPPYEAKDGLPWAIVGIKNHSI